MFGSSISYLLLILLPAGPVKVSAASEAADGYRICWRYLWSRYGCDIHAGLIYSIDRIVSYLMLITINILGRDLFLSLTLFKFSCLAN